MTEYIGKDEQTLRSLLDACTSFEERRKIRAAIRQLKDGAVKSHSFSVKPFVSSALDNKDAGTGVARPSLGLHRTSSDNFNSISQRRSYHCGTSSSDGTTRSSSGDSWTPSGDSNRVPRHSGHLSSSEGRNGVDRYSSRYSSGGTTDTRTEVLPPRSFHSSTSNSNSNPNSRSYAASSADGNSVTQLRSSHLSTSASILCPSSVVSVGPSTDCVSSHTSRVESHHPIIKAGHDKHSNASRILVNIRESLNSVVLRKNVLNIHSTPPQTSSSVNFRNGVSNALTDLASEGLATPLQEVSSACVSSARSVSLSSDDLTRSSDNIPRWRSASYTSIPGADNNIKQKTAASALVINDSVIENCKSEEYLQYLLLRSSEFVERRKLRTRIRELRENREDKDLVEKGDLKKSNSDDSKVKHSSHGLTPRGTTLTHVQRDNPAGGGTLQLDYDKIETLEEFKTLLAVTEDYEEKRKIRNSMRQLRRRLDLEKVKLSAGNRLSKAESSLRRQSEDITLHRPQFVSQTDSRRLSEDGTSTKVNTGLDKREDSTLKHFDLRQTDSDSIVRLNYPTVEIQFSTEQLKQTVTTSEGGRAGNKVGPCTDRADKAGTSSSTSVPKKAEAGAGAGVEEEDFLSKIKARLSSREKGQGGQSQSITRGSQKSKDSGGNTDKRNTASSKPGPSPPHVKDRKGNLSKTADVPANTRKVVLTGKGKLLTPSSSGQSEPFVSKKGKSQPLKTDNYNLIIDSRRESTLKSNLTVKLNSGATRGSDAKDKVRVSKGIDSKKRVLPDVDKLKFKAGGFAVKKTTDSEKRTVFDRLSQGKESPNAVPSKHKGNVELNLSAVSPVTSVSVKTIVTESSSLVPKDHTPETPTVSSNSSTTLLPTTASATSNQKDSSRDHKFSDSTDQCAKRTGDSNNTECFVVKSDKCTDKYVFKVDLKPKSKGLSRSHSDVLPQTRSWFKKTGQVECNPLKSFENRSDIEKAFMDMLDDIDHVSTASDTKLSDLEISDDDLDQVTSKTSIQTIAESTDNDRDMTMDTIVAGVNQHVEQSKSWILLRNVKEDLSAIKFIDENDNSEVLGNVDGGQHGQMTSGQPATLGVESRPSTIEEVASCPEENNNVQEKLTIRDVESDVMDNFAGVVDTAGVPSGSDSIERETSSGHSDNTVSAHSDSAITYQEDDDGTVTVQQVTQDDHQDRVVTVRSKIFRTPSNAQAEERDTVVETLFTSPGGTQLQERDVIKTKKRLTSRGSNYFQRSVQVTRRVRDTAGGEVVEQDNCVESDSKSVSKGQSWGDRVITKVTLDKPNQQQPMIQEAADAPKKSHATLVLSKLNVSKASSGYGSVSGSEEDDREEIIDIHQTRPKGCPEITVPVKDVDVREGDDVVLECAATADPAPAVTWYLGYQQIDADDNRYHTHFVEASGKATLTICCAENMDSGQFRCVFTNQYGEAETKNSVTVKKKPEKVPVFSLGLHDETVIEGHSITLTCTVADAETIGWYKDGFVQRNSSDFKQSYDGDVARLEIGEVFLDDVGEYACVARNELGEDRTACQITVTACDTETSVVPMFLTKFTKSVIKVGDKLLLECDIIGSPEPGINWTKDGRPLREDCPYNEMYDGRTAKLEIEDVTTDDSGKYECIAVNEAGRVSLDASVTVQVKNKSPSVTVPLCDVDIKAGESAILTCHISGFPQPSVLWRKNGMLIGHTKDFKQMYDGRIVKLEIYGVCFQDSGQYECVARNGLGETSTTCLLTVKDTSAPQESMLPPSSNMSSSPITRSTTPPQTIIGLALSRPASQRSSHGPLHLSSPTSPTASQNISSSSVGQATSHTSTKVVSPLVSPSTALPTHIIGKALTRSASMTITTVASSATSPSAPLPADVIGSAETLSSSKMSTSLVTSQECKASASFTRSASQRSITVISSPESSPTTPLSSHVLGKAITRSASQRVTSSSQSSSSPPQSIIGKALETLAAKSPSSHQNVSRSLSSPTNTQIEILTKPLTGTVGDPPRIIRNIPSTESISVPARSKPLNTIGKFLALSAAKDLGPSFPIRTTLDSPTERSPSPVTPTQHQESSNLKKAQTQTQTQTLQLSKVQQLRLQFLGEANQTKQNKVSSAPIRRWHSLPPQDLKPIIVKKEKGSVTRAQQLHSSTDSRGATMPTYEDINDEEELMKVMSKTDDFDERKKIRARLKEVREIDKLEREAKRMQREKESEDVVKKRFEKAEEDKKRKMQQFSDMAAKPSSVATTTKTGSDGAQITTTTTTSTSTQKADGGGTRTQTVKKTETTITKTSGMGGMQYAKPGAAKPGGSRGAMAAFKQMDATNSPAQPNALVTVSLAKKAATTMRRNAIAIKQEVLAFCKHNTKEYKTIQITNFSSCWNNGLAFCALIHHFFPDAFDFNALTPKNRRYNFDLAFDTAEQRADIAPLLDTDDMVRMKNPDWKCVFTYVQSIYRHLRDHDANKAKEAEQ
ncbi:uncharacterized protein LOC124147724 isoform X3 [Haliotis rufescens]|uniref:uncharacterized protein LOC124147724 isoform X3 n=1 Tax=Haliotis rufescens TaxID=6454 RepID=UPI00201E7BAE|nr:uncharacterized protein LOC124147724 isoform X3 [Haliotis rufescens]